MTDAMPTKPEDALVERLTKAAGADWDGRDPSSVFIAARDAITILLERERRKDAALKAVKERCFSSEGDENWAYDILSIVVPILEARAALTGDNLKRKD